jgi:hypothetical protein
MKNKIIVLTAGAILIFSVVVIFLYNQNSTESNNSSPTPTLTPTNTPTPTPAANLPEDWETYKSENLGISLRYPKNMQIKQNQDGSVSFTLLGPTQAEGTEVYDGIIINFNTGSYEFNTFKEFVTNKHNEQQNDPIISDVSEIEEITINEMTGYKFSIVGLGEFTILYLPMENSQYLRVSMLVEDPKNQGFQDTVNTILTSISY